MRVASLLCMHSSVCSVRKHRVSVVWTDLGAYLDEVIIFWSCDGKGEALRPYEGTVAAGGGRASVVAQLPALPLRHDEICGRRRILLPVRAHKAACACGMRRQYAYQAGAGCSWLRLYHAQAKVKPTVLD